MSEVFDTDLYKDAKWYRVNGHVPPHHREPIYKELLRRYTQARSHWRTIKPLVLMGLIPEITEREYCDTFVDQCFPAWAGSRIPGKMARDLAFEECYTEVFQ